MNDKEDKDLQSEAICTVDEEFLNELRKTLDYNPETGEFKWKINASNRIKTGSIAGCKSDQNRRCQIRFKGKKHSAHRLAWLLHYGKWPERVIDHIDGDPFNNAIVNLRDVSGSLNQQNQRRAQFGSQTGLLGVSPHKNSGKFKAQIQVLGKQKYLGLFLTPQEAHEVYLAAKRELHEGCTL